MTHQTDREIYNIEVPRENQIVRENNAASSGLTLGIVLTSLVGLGVGAFFFINQGTDTKSPSSQTTIIERTKEAVPVPEQKAPDVNITAPSPAEVKLPDVNVNVPNPAPQNNDPAPQNNAPSAQPAPAQP